MKFVLSKSFPLGAKEQIKRQIRAMITDGSLRQGHRLPSAKDLGRFLDINRNTVAAVYKELEAEGLLSIVKGSGTVVRQVPSRTGTADLEQIFSQAYRAARESGHTRQDILDAFVTGLLRKQTAKKADSRIILIDCNHEVLAFLSDLLKQQCRFRATPLLIQDIESDPAGFRKTAETHDLVVCGMNHMEELRLAVPDLDTEVVGFLLKTDFTVLNRIMQMPPGTRAAYCCISEKSAKAFFKNIPFSSGSSLKRAFVGIGDKKGLQELMAGCDILFATNYVYRELMKMQPSIETVCVNLSVDPDNLAYIVNRIQQGEGNGREPDKIHQ